MGGDTLIWAKNRPRGQWQGAEKKGGTAAKVTAEIFDRLKEQFLTDIETTSKFASDFKDLVINWDQTVVKYVPVLNWTQEVKGTKWVPIAGIDDKRQITATFDCHSNWRYVTSTNNIWW